MTDQFQGMRNVIEEAIRDANSQGLDYTGQTGHAVRIVMAIDRDMGAPEAMALVKAGASGILSAGKPCPARHQSGNRHTLTGWHRV